MEYFETKLSNTIIMSVLSHLTTVASKLIITENERGVIDGNISALSNKLYCYFNSGVISGKIVFGSYARKTLMPRKADSRSDVDYMIVFSSSQHSPSTYLTWLKNFAIAKYPSSEIFQSYPTIVLELSKIKIELVPAIKSAYDSYQIPAPSSNYTNWLVTHPNDFNSRLRNKNTSEKSMIRPLVRLMKYWNALNNYVYSSFELEGLIANHSYFNCNNLWEYFESFVNGLSIYWLVPSKADKVSRLKRNIAKARQLINEGYENLPETEVVKEIPVY